MSEYHDNQPKSGGAYTGWRPSPTDDLIQKLTLIALGTFFLGFLYFWGRIAYHAIQLLW